MFVGGFFGKKGVKLFKKYLNKNPTIFYNDVI